MFLVSATRHDITVSIATQTSINEDSPLQNGADSLRSDDEIDVTVKDTGTQMVSGGPYKKFLARKSARRSHADKRRSKVCNKSMDAATGTSDQDVTRRKSLGSSLLCQRNRWPSPSANDAESDVIEKELDKEMARSQVRTARRSDRRSRESLLSQIRNTPPEAVGILPVMLETGF